MSSSSSTSTADSSASSSSSDSLVPPAVVSSVHAAIRRGSVLKATGVAAPTHTGISKSTVVAYQQAATAGENEKKVLAELQAKGGSISLRSVPLPADTTAAAAKQLYLQEQAAEAAVLDDNAKLLKSLREAEEQTAPPPPPPTEGKRIHTQRLFSPFFPSRCLLLSFSFLSHTHTDEHL